MPLASGRAACCTAPAAAKSRLDLTLPSYADVRAARARSSYEYDDDVDDGDGIRDGDGDGEGENNDVAVKGSAYGIPSAAAQEPDPNPPRRDDDFTKEGGFCCPSDACDNCLANGVPHPAGFCGTISGCADW